MMRDSVKAYYSISAGSLMAARKPTSKRTIILDIDKDRKRAYKSVCFDESNIHDKGEVEPTLREPGSSFGASFLANSRNSLTDSSTWVLEDIGLKASVQRFMTYRSRGCQIPTVGELAGTLKTPPLVLGTETALSHSFQKVVMDAFLPKIP